MHRKKLSPHETNEQRRWKCLCGGIPWRTHLDGLVVMAVHVVHEEVEHSHVHEIQQPATLVVRFDLLDDITVFLVRLPICFSPLVIGSSPGMAPRFARGYFLMFNDSY